MDKVRNHIKFVDDTHQYFNMETGEECKSVTKFVSNYYPPFNADDIAYKLVTTSSRYIKRFQGLTVPEAVEKLKGEWEERTRIGTEVHNILETYILSGKKDNKYTDIFDTLRLQEKYPTYKIIPEMLLYSDKYRIAGQADLVLLDDEAETFKIFDYKTSHKGIQKQSFQDKRMLPPLDHLPDCNYYHYCIQLSVYAQMLWEETNYRCDGLSILWVDTDELVMREYMVGSHMGDVTQILADSISLLQV